MAISLDVGTMFLVKGEVEPDSKQPAFSVERNCFLQSATGEDTEDTLKDNNWSYIKYGDHFYILGEDAIKLKNLLTIKSGSDDKNIVVTQVGDLRRPMKDGLLNTGEEKLSVAIIQQIIKDLIGPPSYKNEPLCFCAPGDPLDKNLSVVFHRTMLTNFLKTLGYSVECIPEALAIIFSQRPVAEDPNEEGGEAPFSGLAISCGAGMMNCCFAWKKMPLINFSVARSGDWIDSEAAKVSGIDVSAMTRYKEKNLDLNSVDYGDMRQAALDIFYQNMIEHALSNFAEKFNELDNQIDVPLEIVVAGGTASVPGFIEKFEEVAGGLDLPFAIKGIRLAKNPLYAVSHGCLLKSVSMEKKIGGKTQDEKTEKTQEEQSRKVKINK